MINSLLTINDKGIYCKQADLYIDPWKPFERAVITHAHSDHVRCWGVKRYVAHPLIIPLMKRWKKDKSPIDINTLEDLKNRLKLY